MNVYLVRHTETTDNINKIIQGQDDSPLTPKGIVLAVNSLQYFSDINVDRIISSPLGRAKKTAMILREIIGKPYKRIAYSDSFKEIDLGKWTKMPIEQLKEHQGNNSYNCYKTAPSCFCPDDGEGIRDLQKRVVDGYNDIIDKCKKNNNIVIVSHSVAIRSLLVSLEGKDIDQLWSYVLPPACKTKIEIKDGISMVEKIGF